MNPAVSRPLLLVDIDGVLNPYARPGEPWPAHYTDHRVAGLRVLLSSVHGEWLRELAELYDLAWVSTWAEDSDALIGPLIGAPRGLPWIPLLERDEQDWVWKLPGVTRFVGDRAVAWLDDEPGHEADEWAATRAAPTLLVKPVPHLGWERHDYRRLTAFAADPDTMMVAEP